jgi:hypothetical protein
MAGLDPAIHVLRHEAALKRVSRILLSAFALRASADKPLNPGYSLIDMKPLVPAQAGTQHGLAAQQELDSRLRGNERSIADPRLVARLSR